jgi:hypothetical protein
LSLSSDEEEDFESDDIWKNYFKIERRRMADIDLSSSDSENNSSSLSDCESSSS